MLLHLRRLSIRCREQQHPLDASKVKLSTLWDRLPPWSHGTVLQWTHRSRCSKYDVFCIHIAHKFPLCIYVSTEDRSFGINHALVIKDMTASTE